MLQVSVPSWSVSVTAGTTITQHLQRLSQFLDKLLYTTSHVEGPVCACLLQPEAASVSAYQACGKQASALPPALKAYILVNMCNKHIST